MNNALKSLCKKCKNSKFCKKPPGPKPPTTKPPRPEKCPQLLMAIEKALEALNTCVDASGEAGCMAENVAVRAKQTSCGEAKCDDCGPELPDVCPALETAVTEAGGVLAACLIAPPEGGCTAETMAAGIAKLLCEKAECKACGPELPDIC